MKRYSLAIVGKVDAKVHEIILSPTGLVNDPFQHGLVHFVGDVPKHNLQDGQWENRSRMMDGLTVVRTSIPSRMRVMSTWL